MKPAKLLIWLLDFYGQEQRLIFCVVKDRQGENQEHKNALPSTLRDISDRARFRKLLKTHLFDSSS